MKEEVISFINRFTNNGQNKEVINTFTHGCCYWFAYILEARFCSINNWDPDTRIMYDQIENHFGCRIDGIVYDITGDVTDKYNWQTWTSMMLEDELLTERIIRDCIVF